MQYSLPLEHFEATAGLLIGLLSILLCLSEHRKALAEGNRQGIVSGAVNTPTTFIKFAAVSVLWSHFSYGFKMGCFFSVCSGFYFLGQSGDFQTSYAELEVP